MLKLNAAQAELRAALPAAAAAPLETAAGAPASAAGCAMPCCESQMLQGGGTQTEAARKDGTTVFACGHTTLEHHNRR